MSKFVNSLSGDRCEGIQWAGLYYYNPWWNPLRSDVFPFVLLYACLAGLFLQYPVVPVDVIYRSYDPEGISLMLWGLAAVLAVLSHILLLFCCLWSVNICAFVRYSKASSLSSASHVLVIPPSHCGASAFCALQNSSHFEFQQIEYLYDQQSECFQPSEYPLDLPISFYSKHTGVNGSSGKYSQSILHEQFGPNEYHIPIPSFFALYLEHAVEPFFVFQVFCVVLWLLDEYWYYSLMTLALFVMFEGTVVNRRLKNLEHIRSMRSKPQDIFVLRDGMWTCLQSDQLLPYDIISISPPLDTDSPGFPCDVLILQGEVVVNESLLTGESVPQIKDSVLNNTMDDSEPLSIHSKHKNAVVFAGTQVLASQSDSSVRSDFPRPPDNGSIAFVLRTGFSTSQGNLIRTILYSTERVTVNSSESLYFILIMMVFALIASAYVMVTGLADPSRDRFKLILNCIMIITSVVPPELPMELSLAVNTSLGRLVKKGVFCTEPFRIPFAGRIDICNFDKTGTLTSDKFQVLGIAGIKNDLVVMKDGSIPSDTLYVLAGCQSVSNIKGKWAGDPMEKAILSEMGCVLTKSGVSDANGLWSIETLMRFSFNSTEKRMSCIVSVKKTAKKFKIVAKGAPEVMKDLFSSVPDNYEKMYNSLTQKGHRILALGSRDISQNEFKVLFRSKSRTDTEKGLTFRGFVVLDSPLKSESLKSIRELKKSSHQVTMITGDNIFTACEIARKLEMVEKPTLVLDTELVWKTVSGDTEIAFDMLKVTSLKKSYSLCLSGKSMDLLSFEKVSDLDMLYSSTDIFARVSPQQKELILQAQKRSRKYTLMCGDGTNDVGALKQAHCGVALIQITARKMKRKSILDKQTLEIEEETPIIHLGDASIAAPFTSKKPNIQNCVELIKQGRCTLVTTIQMYKILALNCLVSAYSMSVLFMDGVKLGDTQATVYGLVLAMLYLFMSQSKPAPKLSKKRPHAEIFSLYMLVSIAGQFAWHMMWLLVAVGKAKPFIGVVINPENDFDVNIVNTVVYLMQCVMTLSTFTANYKGKPFMQSLKENKDLYMLIVAALLCCVVCASNAFPPLADMLELSHMPDSSFGLELIAMMLIDFFGAIGFQKSVDHWFQ